MTVDLLFYIFVVTSFHHSSFTKSFRDRFIFSRLLKPSLIQLVVYPPFLDASGLNCLEDQEVGS